jgi:hypothetical protein
MASDSPQPPSEHEHDEDLQIIVTIDETTLGTFPDGRLPREPTEAILELLTVHLSRVHIVPALPEDERPHD